MTPSKQKLYHVSSIRIGSQWAQIRMLGHVAKGQIDTPTSFNTPAPAPGCGGDEVGEVFLGHPFHYKHVAMIKGDFTQGPEVRVGGAINLPGT